MRLITQACTARRFRAVLTGAVAALLAAGAAVPARAETPEGINVIGAGEVQVTPDMARVTLEVRREGPDAAALKAELDESVAAILALTESLGIEARDVTAAGVTIYPRYDPRDDESQPSGVVATRPVEVTLRDLAIISDLIDGALERGANGIGGVQLDASNRAELEQQAVDKAIDDAVRQAKQIAKRFQVELGPLRSASTSASSGGPMPMMETMAVRGAKAFAPGEMTIHREMQATFGIRP